MVLGHLTLKFGHNKELPSEEISAPRITIFVGPNNSGKSRALHELLVFCQSGELSPRGDEFVIFDEISLGDYRVGNPERYVEERKLKKEAHEYIPSLPDIIVMPVGQGGRVQVEKEKLLKALGDPQSDLRTFCEIYLADKTVMLDGQGRLGALSIQSLGPLDTPPINNLDALFKVPEKMDALREAFLRAFELKLVLDPTTVGQLALKTSEVLPERDFQLMVFNEDLAELFSKAIPIEDYSDGVKAYLGILLSVIAGDPLVTFIDEPEAFLHPPLASKLGIELAKVCEDSGKQIFVSTHSSDFLMGCISSGIPVNIVRLTYKDGEPTARALSDNDVLELVKNPLMRSTGVIDALFYEYAVVVEADSDRAFYQEINDRLIKAGDPRGIPNCLFVNAQNKQTVRSIVAPLRKLGIPVAGIVDVDVVKEGGSVWSGFLKAGSVPQMEISSLGDLRGKVRRELDSTGKDMKKEGGIELLQGSEKEAANNLFDNLERYGLFVVRGGEVESWLSDLNVGGHGTDWLIAIFEEMGNSLEDTGYLVPSQGDVWDFLGSISKWLSDSKRKGIPD